MVRASTVLFFIVLIAQVRAQAPSAKDLEADRRLLQQNSIGAEGPELLQLFRDRTLSKEQIADLEKHVRLLASTSLAERKKATGVLIKAGALSRKMLQELIKDKDASLETVRRAEVVLAKIAEGKDVQFAIATAHLIAHEKPAGSGQTLLDFIPFASDARLLEEVQAALNTVALIDGKIDPAFLKAVDDKLVAKRAAAGEAIIRAGGLKQKSAVEKLTDDESPQVRVAVLVALVEAQDKKSVPKLIDQLATAPKDRLWQIEDLLHRIAGEKAPEIWVGAKSSPKLVRTGWVAWWQTNQQTVNLAKLSDPPRYRGFVVVSNAGQDAPKDMRGSKVLEVKPSKQVGLQFSFPRSITDAQILSKERLLVAEGRKVTERDFKTNIYWEKEIEKGTLIHAQRLPGGDTFIATSQELLIVDPVGQVMFAHKVNKEKKEDDDDEDDPMNPKTVNIVAAGRARDGHMVYVDQTGKCTWIDREGFVVRSFVIDLKLNVNDQQTMRGGGGAGYIDVLPGQRIVMALSGRVAEFDPQGKMVWSASVAGATSAIRIPNGNTVVANGGRVSELDRNGEEVWSFQPDFGIPTRVRHR